MQCWVLPCIKQVQREGVAALGGIGRVPPRRWPSSRGWHAEHLCGLEHMQQFFDHVQPDSAKNAAYGLAGDARVGGEPSFAKCVALHRAVCCHMYGARLDQRAMRSFFGVPARTVAAPCGKHRAEGFTSVLEDLPSLMLLKELPRSWSLAAAETAASERWAGQRTVFAEADAAADLPQAGAPPPKHAPSAAEALNGMGATGSAAERAASGAASIAAVLAGVKWRKLAARALTEVRRAAQGAVLKPHHCVCPLERCVAQHVHAAYSAAVPGACQCSSDRHSAQCGGRSVRRACACADVHGCCGGHL